MRHTSCVTASSPSLLDLSARIAAIVSARAEVLDAYLFGSYGRGEQHALSDVDVAVWIDAAVDCDAGYGIDSEVTADLMAGLGRNDIDVVLLNRAGPLLYHRVLRDGLRVFTRDVRATTVREGRALSRYCDFVPTLAILRAADARSARLALAARGVRPARPAASYDAGAT